MKILVDPFRMLGARGNVLFGHLPHQGSGNARSAPGCLAIDQGRRIELTAELDQLLVPFITTGREVKVDHIHRDSGVLGRDEVDFIAI